MNEPMEEAQDAAEQTDQAGGADPTEEGEELESVLARVMAWGEAWSQTESFATLTEEQQEAAQPIVEALTHHMFEYHDSLPEDWTPQEIEACCVRTMPERVTEPAEFFAAVAPVLAGFFTYLDGTGHLSQGARLAERVRRLDNRIVRAAADPRNWGMTKALMMGSQGAGVDAMENADMSRFMNQYGAGLLGGDPSGPEMPEAPPQIIETYVRATPKVGRNEPCPCGSGKKYKRCCGA